jgi:hypothetical protein
MAKERTPPEGVSARPSRLSVGLVIKRGSPLRDGRLPLQRIERGDELEIEVDPVSLAALLASVGRPFTVAQAEQGIWSLRKGDLQGDQSDSPGESQEGESA